MNHRTPAPNETAPPAEKGVALPGSLKKAYERFVKIRGNPREIALGFALGLLVGMSPTLGVQMAIAVFFAALFKWNKISAAVGVWISNPVTAPFIYYATYTVGARILGVEPAASKLAGIDGTTFWDLFLKTPEILWAAALGGVVLGLPVAVAGYFFAFSAINKYRDDIKKKLEARKKKRATRTERRKTGKRRKR